MIREQKQKPTECFAFEWWRRVKGRGFRWKPDPKDGPHLVGPPNEALQRYEPLVEETGLCLTFAGLDGSEDGFLQFANTYGRLGTYYGYYPDHGEPFGEWQAHHRWMHFLAALRHQLRQKRPQLGEWVRWKGHEVVFTFPAITRWGSGDWRYRGEHRDCLKNQGGVPLFRVGDLHGPAHWFLASAIDEWLQTLMNFRQPIATRMVWSEQHNRPRFVLMPQSLLGAMVYQFAAALHGAWPFQECAFCHKYFRLAPGVNRANRRTCSITCKQYLHNQRVEQARALRAKGRSIPEIVRELKVKPHRGKSGADIVKHWIESE
jgi:hypothetical protein